MAAGTLASLWSKKLKAKPEQEGQVTPKELQSPRNEAAVKLSQHMSDPKQDMGSQQPEFPSQQSLQRLSQQAPGPEDGAALSKKRKRARFSDHQQETLRAAFSKTAYPGKAERKELAAGLGLEASQVLNWFENERKKLARSAKDADKATANPPSARHQLAGNENVISVDSDDDALAQPKAPPQSEEPGQEELPPQMPSEPQDREGEINHAKNGSVRPEEATGLQVKEAGAAMPSEINRAPFQQETEQHLDGEDGRLRTNKAAKETAAFSDAPGAQPEAEMMEGVENREPRPESCTVPTSEAEQQEWTPEKFLAEQEKIRARANSTVQFVHSLKPLETLPTQPLTAVCKPQIAAILAGCPLQLEQLLDSLCCPTLDREALRNCILDLATRKSFAGKEGKNEERVDALSNEDASLLWRWELRSLQSLPKAQRPRGQQLKKSLTEASNLLTGLNAACAALGEAAENKKARPKALKALAKLEKLPAPDLSQQPTQPSDLADEAVAENKAAIFEAAREARQQDEREKEISRQAREAEKERVRQEKEVEKQAKEAERETQRKEKEDQRKEKEELKAKAKREKELQKVEKEAEKERQKQEKEKEREQQRLEKEQQKQVKKLQSGLAGFGSVKTIAKSRNAFTSFFKKTPAAAAGSKPNLAAATPGTESPIKIRALDDAFSPAEQDVYRAPEVADAVVARLDEELGKTQAPEAIHSHFEDLLLRWKELPKHRRVKGLPPSWARRPHATARAMDFEDSENQAEEVSCITWRRKFLWFPVVIGDDGLGYPQPHWPPYYGSWSKTSAAIKPRRPFAKDASLDYDVMEDEEWEPEPEGDSLSVDEADDEDMCADESGNDGFFVSDGQLSEDEGLSSVQQDIDTLCAEQDDETASVPLADFAKPDNAAAGAQRRLLEAALAKARPRPIIISRLKLDAAGAGNCLTGDPLLLSALSMQVVAASIRVTLPLAPAEEAATKPAGPTKPSAGGSERPDELVPELAKFLQSHPEIKAVPKAVKAFCEAHPERKLVKKWLTEKIKEVAERTSTGWKLKSEAASAMGLPVEEPPESSQPQAEREAAGKEAGSTPAIKSGAMLKFLSKGQEVTPNKGTDGQPAALGTVCQLPPDSKAVRKTSDPRWQALVAALVQPAPSYTASSVDGLFTVVKDVESAAAIPEFAVTAVLKTLGSEAAPLLREACARNAARIVTLLAEPAPSPLSPPHKVWGDARSLPRAASLEAILDDPQLQERLLACLANSHVDLAKNTAMLIGAMVRIGCPQRLSVAALNAAVPVDDIPAGLGAKAVALRCRLAGAGKWLDALTADSRNSATLLAYQLLVLCYLLFEPACSDSLLDQPGNRSRLLNRFFAAASHQNTGCAKYGLLGLLLILRRDAALQRAFEDPGVSGSSLERVLRTVERRLREKRQALTSLGAAPDEASLAALEVARILGDVQAKHGSLVSDKTDKCREELCARDDLLAVLAALKDGGGLGVQAASERACQALMQPAPRVDMDTS